jgi:hypothetical protein
MAQPAPDSAPAAGAPRPAGRGYRTIDTIERLARRFGGRASLRRVLADAALLAGFALTASVLVR